MRQLRSKQLRKPHDSGTVAERRQPRARSRTMRQLRSKQLRKPHDSGTVAERRQREHGVAQRANHVPNNHTKPHNSDTVIGRRQPRARNRTTRELRSEQPRNRTIRIQRQDEDTRGHGAAQRAHCTPTTMKNARFAYGGRKKPAEGTEPHNTPTALRQLTARFGTAAGRRQSRGRSRATRPLCSDNYETIRFGYGGRKKTNGRQEILTALRAKVKYMTPIYDDF